MRNSLSSIRLPNHMFKLLMINEHFGGQNYWEFGTSFTIKHAIQCVYPSQLRLRERNA